MDAEIITIANKLARKDSVTGLDVWYATKLPNIPYSVEFIANATNTITSTGQIMKILIPFSDKYRQYRDWVKEENKSEFYTMSQGDYIFVDTDVEEEITANNIVKLKERYAPNAVKVQSIIEVPKRDGILYQLKVVAI